jgi:hypothetical protein
MPETQKSVSYATITTITSRMERVIMLSIISLFLKMMESITPILWTTVFIGSLNILSMTVLHTIQPGGSVTRLLFVIRRVTLFIFSHAIMKATMSDSDGTANSEDSKDKILVIIKGLAVLAALTLIPPSVAAEDDGDQFSSQIVYAFSTNVVGILKPLQSSRIFVIISFMVILISPHARKAALEFTCKARLIGPMCDVTNLIFFDAFTSVAFTPTGDRFLDLAIILGVFSLLWNFHDTSSDLHGIQQFTTWRTATFITLIFSEIQLTGITLATLMFVTVTLLRHIPHATKNIPWLIDLVFLVGLNGAIRDVTGFVNSMGDRNGIPVLLGFIIIIATINSTMSNMQAVVIHSESANARDAGQVVSRAVVIKQSESLQEAE